MRGSRRMDDERLDNYWQRLRAGRASRRRLLAGGVTALTGGIAFGLVGCSSSNNNTGGSSNRGAATVANGSGASAPTAAAATAAGTARSTAAPGGSPAAAGSPAAGAVATVQPFDSKLKTGGT